MKKNNAAPPKRTRATKRTQPKKGQTALSPAEAEIVRELVRGMCDDEKAHGGRSAEWRAAYDEGLRAGFSRGHDVGRKVERLALLRREPLQIPARYRAKSAAA